MNQVPQMLVNEALDLPVGERGQLAALLIASLDGKTDGDAQNAWSDEIHERLREIDAGEVAMVPWADARRLIRGEDATDAG